MRLAVLLNAKFNSAEYLKNKNVELKDLSANITFQDIFYQGTQNKYLMKAVETVVENTDLLEISKFNFLIKPEMIQRFIAKKQLQMGIQ